MSLYETVHPLQLLIAALTRALQKVYRNNKAAAQRVRVGTIRLEKVAKHFRKESVTAQKRWARKAKKRRARKKRSVNLSQ